METKIETPGQTAYMLIKTHHHAKISIEESCRIINKWLGPIRELEKEVFGVERSPLYDEAQIRSCRVFISKQ